MANAPEESKKTAALASRLAKTHHDLTSATMKRDALVDTRITLIRALTGEGWGYERIGSVLGISKQAVNQIVVRAKKKAENRS